MKFKKGDWVKIKRDIHYFKKGDIVKIKFINKRCGNIIHCITGRAYEYEPLTKDDIERPTKDEIRMSVL